MANRKETFLFAFRKSLPIMTGFLFLGMTYGIYMNQQGFNFLYPTLMALTIYGGSVEFIIANLLTKAFDPWAVLIVTLIVSSRHLFYAISMLDRYGNTGWRKPFLIFGMSDETFSLNYSTKVPLEFDKKKVMFTITILNQIYWVSGACLGGLFGSLIAINVKGLSFVMTALFIVMMTDQFLREDHHFSSLTGLFLSLGILAVTGKTYFMPITLFLLVVIFAILEKRKERFYDFD
ncbi:AzlC family ABC transporter permease [Fructobacillus ficulneus]|uniref:LIV-E family branched chain amino acid permease AzlC n=1 Tax=Fructobacillus ficulneus TaxID=157463 RepID=A0A0K8MIR9_9LACO|nr:AzlC family ABC transporter permease [Fructobacillus ficulneus]GAP00358.1 LIV-E family branched chain amino acid permease AzlC [Fructobacillus ficulneus]